MPPSPPAFHGPGVWLGATALSLVSLLGLGLLCCGWMRAHDGACPGSGLLSRLEGVGGLFGNGTRPDAHDDLRKRLEGGGRRTRSRAGTPSAASPLGSVAPLSCVTMVETMPPATEVDQRAAARAGRRESRAVQKEREVAATLAALAGLADSNAARAQADGAGLGDPSSSCSASLLANQHLQPTWSMPSVPTGAADQHQDI